jgi:integrase
MEAISREVVNFNPILFLPSRDELQDILQDYNKAKRIFELLDAGEGTINDYKSRIDSFLDFVNDRGFNNNSFREYKRHLDNRIDIKSGTKQKYLIAARVWLRELNRVQILKTDLTSNTKGFKQDKKHKRDGITEEELSLVMDKIKLLESTPEAARLRALFTILALQGLRQIEIIRLDVTDLDLKSGTCFVKGKGRDDKERIYLHPESVKALTNYLELNKIKSGALFVSNSNRSKNQRLTTRGLREIIKDVLKQLDINNCTHGFRHYFTTKLIKTYKGDVLEVAKYTRHKSLEMLQVYNDNINHQADLPRYYQAFAGVSF